MESTIFSGVYKHFMIRKISNAGDKVKMYCSVTRYEGMEDVLIIRQLILSDNFSLYLNKPVLKYYKKYGLFENIFSIKLSTLREIINEIDLTYSDTSFINQN